MAVTFILIRHAQPTLVSEYIYGSIDVNIDDINLFTDNIGLYPYLKYSRWISSTLSRARRTAEIIKRYYNSNITIEEDSRLNEQNFGELEGVNPANIFKEFSSKRKYWHFPYDFKPENGESFIEVVERCKSFISCYLQEENSCYILFTHGGFIRAFLSVVLDLTAESIPKFDISPLSYSVITYDNSKWHIKSIATQLI